MEYYCKEPFFSSDLEGPTQQNGNTYIVAYATEHCSVWNRAWKNDDSTLHTVTSGRAEGRESGTIFDSSYLLGGKTYEWKFNNAGTFDYYCTLHPFMNGKIVVQ